MPKFHYGQHVSILASAGNPRVYWCYPDEDFMRIVKLVAEKCLAGSPPTLVAQKIVRKMLLGKVAMMFFASNR